MIKFLNANSRLILFIMDIYIRIYNSVKDKDFETIIKSIINNIGNIFSFIRNVVLDLTFSINVSKYSNNDFIVYIRDNVLYYLDLHNFDYKTTRLHYGDVYVSREPSNIIYCNINCHPYVFLDDSYNIYVVSVSGETRFLSKWKIRGVTLNDAILDSIDIEENKLKIKDITKCSECYYNITFMDGESFIILIDPINDTYSCYNSNHTMEELHQASIDNDEEIIYRF